MSQTIRIGIIGCGGFAGVHARRLRTIPDVEVVGLADSNLDAIKNFQEKWFADVPSKPQSFDNDAAMLEATRPDAVIIVTPHSLHFEQARKALNFGCHVLVEKPMVTNSRDAKELSELVGTTKKVLVVGYNTPCTHPVRKIRELVRSGELGELQLVSAYISQDWLRYTKDTWRLEPNISGGGFIMDSGAHLLATLLFCVEQPIKNVYAETENLGQNVEINGTFVACFEKNVYANFSFAGNCSSDGGHIAFFFENGKIESDGWSGSFAKIFRRSQVEVEEITNTPDATPTHNFIYSILGKEEPFSTVALGNRLANFMTALYESARSKKSIDLVTI
ncbi:MAG TPA: Gfo/Idh/MocA family oxidoreductase [Fimbriimonadales bacterium]|nr:Gfo/Idh/MocA family oxidoreductase [Fimbriimonadales bacterium]